MLRARLVPTRIASATELADALRALGFRDVEVHDTPVPLIGWQGKATGREAHVIVRRTSIGPSADDAGFVRNARGGLDAVLSDIHLYRFNARLFVRLEELCPTRIDGPAEAFSNLPPIAPRPAHESKGALLTTTSSTAPGWLKRGDDSPPPRRVTNTLGEELRHELPPEPISSMSSAVVLEPSVRRGVEAAIFAARKRSTAPGVGCIFVLAVPLMLSLPGFMSGRSDAAIGSWILLAFGVAIGSAIWVLVRFGAAARAGVVEFDKHFRLGAPERAAAVTHLRRQAAAVADANEKRVLDGLLRRVDPRIRSVAARVRRQGDRDH